MPTALERFLNPKSIAIAGVSSKGASLGGSVLDNLERYQFAGAVHLVHPAQREIRGRQCVASVGDLAPGVDCVVLAIPAAAVVEAVRQCAAREVAGIVIFAAGFAELGPEGAALQEEIRRIAQAHGIVVEGPNCLGFINEASAAPLSFAFVTPRPPKAAGIAVISQSGALTSALRATMHGRNLDVSISISTGNEAVCGVEDFLEYALSDAKTNLIALVSEGIRQPRRLLQLLRGAADKNLPVVMLSSGASAGARIAALTHTGSMAGDYDVMKVAVESCGVIMAETMEEMVDICDCLQRWNGRRPVGGVGVLCESGAFKGLILDAAERLGLTLPQPEGPAADALNALYPGFIVASNPVDLTAQALSNSELYGKAAEAVMAHPQCGSLLINIILTSEQSARRKMAPVLDTLRAWNARAPVAFAMLGEDSPIPPDIVSAVQETGAPFFRSPERALKTLARIGQWTARPYFAPLALAAETERLSGGTLPEYLAKDILEGYGLPTMPRRLAKSLPEAEAAAGEIGFPLALKVQSRQLSHKSDIGGVILNIADAPALAAAWTLLTNRVHQAAPEAEIDGVLVERMSKPGLELILGARNDPAWGPVVAIGLGGVTAEAIRDIRLLPPWLSQDAIVTEMRKLKGASLLDRFRGRPARDVWAVARVVEGLGRFIAAHPEVIELDVNPLVVLEDGEGAVALDALIVCN